MTGVDIVPKAWPEVPAVRGKSYGVTDPVFKNTMLAVMTMETWMDFGTTFEQQKRLIAQQNATLVQLKTTNDVLTQQLADLQTKHHNLREAVRKERTDKANTGKGILK